MIPWLVGVLALAAGPYQVRELAPDGAWTWYNDERVVVKDSCLYIGSMNSDGRAQVDLYDMARQEPGPHADLSSWLDRDDHNNPALLLLDGHRLLAAYTRHDVEPRAYWRTAQLDGSGIPTWGEEQSMALPAKGTYNNLYRLSDENGRIYNFIRCVGFNPNVLSSDDQGTAWTGPFELIRSGDGGTRPYVKYSGNGRDRIDFLYTDAHPRNDPNNSVYHLYYRSGRFYTSDGTLIKTLEQVRQAPLVPTDGTRIYDGSAPTGRGWVWDLESDDGGQPVGAFINSADGADGNDLRYRYARWDGKTKTWSQRQIAYAGTHLYVPENHYAGGISIDPEDVNQVFISADVSPETGEVLPSGHYQIFQGRTRDLGKTWAWTQLTFDDQTDNLRPVVPRAHGCKVCVLWFQGRYSRYTDFKTRIVGIIE